MRVSAKTDYAVRAMVELAAADGGQVKRYSISEAQSIPVKFLENILAELRHAGLVESQRGADGGYHLTRDAKHISIADVMRAVDGPLASVHGINPESAQYTGNSEKLRDVWVALRSSMRVVLERVSLADILAGELPADVAEMIALPEAWNSG